eukprot:758965-Hanusia_phi.AAC.3
MSQNTTLINADNKITAIFSTTVNLAASLNTKIWISNLTYTQTPSSSSFPVTSSPAGIFRSTASWTQEGGILTIDVIGEQTDVLVYTLEFVLKNPAVGQDEPSISIYATGTTISPIKFDYEIGNFAPLRVGYFTTLFVQQETPSASDWDVGGLKIANSLTDPLDFIPVEGKDRFIIQNLFDFSIGLDHNFSQVSRSASYSPTSQELTLTFLQDTARREQYSFSFLILNPPEGQLSPDISISTTGFEIPWTRMDKAPGILQPLLIAGFVSAPVIWQSNPNTGETNRMTFSMHFFSPIAAGSVLILSDLSLLEPAGAVVELLTTEDTSCNNASCALLFSRVFSSSASSDLNNTFNDSLPGTAGWNGSHLLLRVLSELPSLESPSDSTILLSFDTLNPVLGQWSVDPYVKVLGENSQVSQTAFSKGRGNTAPFLIAGFSVAIVAQSTPSSGGENNITFLLQSYVDLDNSSSFLVTGFKLPHYNASLVSLSLYDTAATRAASLFKAELQTQEGILNISIRPGQNVLSGVNYTITFTITNPLPAQPPPNLFIQTVGQIRSAVVELVSPSLDASPLFIAGFKTKYMQQSSSSTDDLNLLSTSITTTTMLYTGTRIIITGLTETGADTIDGALAIETSSSSIFAADAKWTKVNGTLEVTLQGNMLPLLDYSFNFSVRNPKKGQPGPHLLVQARGPVNVDWVSIDSRNDSFKPLYISDLVDFLISQSTTSASARNSLTMIISLEAPLLPGFAQFRISGLVGSSTPSGLLNLSSDVAVEGNWTRSTGVLLFGLTQQMRAYTNYSFLFHLDNPAESQESPPVSIEVLKTRDLDPRYWSAYRRRMTYNQDLNSAPLLIAGLLSSSIEQATSCCYSPNRLSLSFSSRTLLHQGCSLTISGLVNARHEGEQVFIEQHVRASTDDSAFFTGNMSWNSTGSGVWVQGNDAKVIVYFAQDIFRNETISFSFVVLNPNTGQLSPDVFMETNGDDCAITKTAMIKNANDPPLLVAGDEMR